MPTLIDLRRKLIEEKVFKGTPLRAIAKELELSNSYMTNFIDFLDEKEGHHEVKFDTLLNITKRYYSKPRDIKEIVEDFSNRASKPQNLRMLLEFADEMNDLPFLADLIEKCKRSTNRSLESISRIYDLLYKRKTSTISLLDYKEQLTILKTDTNSESSYLILILESYILYEMRSYNLLKLNVKLLDQFIHELTCEKYLLQRYYQRKEEIKMRMLLKINEMDECRKVAGELVATIDNQRLLASSYYTLGLSYLFESYADCVDNLKKSSELYKNSGLKEFQEFTNYHIGLAKCIHNKAGNDDFSDLSKLDQIYYTAKQKDYALAKQLYNNYLSHHRSIDDVSSLPFLMLLDGLIRKEKDIIWESYTEYMRQGEFFFSQLAKKELEELGTKAFTLSMQ